MDDLISRQAAIEVIDAILPVEPMKNEYAQGITCGAALAKTYVEQLPSAQPDRKKGKWIERKAFDTKGSGIEEMQSAKCSVCGTYHTTPYLYFFDNFNFCPNCGADMRGEKDETD